MPGIGEQGIDDLDKVKRADVEYVIVENKVVDKAPRYQPYWYNYGDPERNPLTMDNYFGRWCIEAVAAVKAFGLDDSLCLGHEHYPGDLLRPNGPTTHKSRCDSNGSSGSIMNRLWQWVGKRT